MRRKALKTIDAGAYYARDIKGTGVIQVSPTGDFQGLLEPMGAVNLRRFNPVEVNWSIKSERDLQYKSIGAHRCSRQFRKRRTIAVQCGYRQQAVRRADHLQPGRQRFPQK